MPAPEHADAAPDEIVTVRSFAAPRELVFAAWSDPAQLAQWWGPDGFSCTFHEFAFHEGGVWRFTMHGPDGTDYANRNVFVTIEPPARIVLDHVNAPRFRLTAVFDAVDGGTRLTFRQTFDSAATRDRVRPYAAPGAAQTLGRLAAKLAAG